VNLSLDLDWFDCKSTTATRALRITFGGQSFCAIGDADFAENSLESASCLRHVTHPANWFGGQLLALVGRRGGSRVNGG
jgi:hypothetical protein